MTAPNPVQLGRDHTPFWIEKLGARYTPPPAEELPAHTGWLIAGAGIAGAALAFELQQRGVSSKDITIVDAIAPGFGASGRNGGFVLTNFGAELIDWRRDFGEAGARDLLALVLRNRQLVSDFCDAHELWTQRGGSYYLAGSEHEGTLLRETARVIAEWTPNETWQYSDSPPAHYPHRHGVLFQPRDFGVNSAEYLLKLIATSGARVVTNCEVAHERIEERRDGVVVHTSAGRIECDRVLLAANAYAPFITRRFDAELEIVPARNQVILAELEGERDNRLWGESLYYANEGYDYWRQLPDGRLLLGGGRNHDLEREVTYEFGENRAIVDYLECLMSRLAQGRKMRIVRRWSGILGFSRHKLPIVGVLPGSNGRVGFAVGFSGLGLGTHRVAAEAAAALMLEGRSAGMLAAERRLSVGA